MYHLFDVLRDNAFDLQQRGCKWATAASFSYRNWYIISYCPNY